MKRFSSILLAIVYSLCSLSQEIVFQSDVNALLLASRGQAATIVCSDDEWAGVKRAAQDLSDDFMRVTGMKAPYTENSTIKNLKGTQIIVGTIGHSQLIDRLVKKGTVRVDDVKGQWESYLIQTIGDNLVIVGSDRRGTIYGIYSLSEKIGVSPWYWWADVAPKRHNEIYVKDGRYVQPSPKVKYRGIFINDEEPSFGSWCRNKFGGYNSKMYTHLFELLLRLKANYLWPAMWNASFNEDDPLNPKLADEYGIVMGTSHHEPMMRSHVEYTSRKEQVGPWNFRTNPKGIEKFFRDGMVRNRNYDNLVTIGMRGDGDVGLDFGSDSANMVVLKSAINCQRKILRDIYGENLPPQLWAVFTEVQRYYDAGFQVPDDVTLLFCDNNWGYIRRKGPKNELNRKGGMGLYYHIDMNGGPWNDRWINTTTIPKLRNQLSLAYQSGLDRIWIINVGDLKPKEVPIDFIMHYAWDPSRVKAGDELSWLQHWARQNFNERYSDRIANLVRRYSKYNLWRKPEVETTTWFDVKNGEASYLVTLWRRLRQLAIDLSAEVTPEDSNAFYQLVYYPVVASASTALVWLYAGMNNYYATHGAKNIVLSSSTDSGGNMTVYADSARWFYRQDSLLSCYYNNVLAHGKWKGIMSDVHIGYKHWFMPKANVMPRLLTILPEAKKRIVAKGDKPSHEFSLAAYNYSDIADGKNNSWTFLSDLGRGKGCMGASDIMAEYDGNLQHSARLDYEFPSDGKDSIHIALGMLPIQDVVPERGLRIAVSVDKKAPVILDARKGLVDTFEEYTEKNLSHNKKMKPLPPVNRHLYLNGYYGPMRNENFDDMRWLDITLPCSSSASQHVIHVYLIDPEVVLERVVVNPDNTNPSYFTASFEWDDMD